MAIKEKDLWHNFFNFRIMSEASIEDVVYLLGNKCSEYGVPVNVCYDRFVTGKLITKDEGQCAIIFNPDSPRGSLRYCVLMMKMQYSTVIQGWKLYNTANTIPPVSKGAFSNNLRTSLFGSNKAEQEWNAIMDGIFDDLKRKIS